MPSAHRQFALPRRRRCTTTDPRTHPRCSGRPGCVPTSPRCHSCCRSASASVAVSWHAQRNDWWISEADPTATSATKKCQRQAIEKHHPVLQGSRTPSFFGCVEEKLLHRTVFSARRKARETVRTISKCSKIGSGYIPGSLFDCEPRSACVRTDAARIDKGASLEALLRSELLLGVLRHLDACHRRLSGSIDPGLNPHGGQIELAHCAMWQVPV